MEILRCTTYYGQTRCIHKSVSVNIRSSPYSCKHTDVLFIHALYGHKILIGLSKDLEFHTQKQINFSQLCCISNLFHVPLCQYLTLVLCNKPIYHIGFAKILQYRFRKAPKKNIEISDYRNIDIWTTILANIALKWYYRVYVIGYFVNFEPYNHISAKKLKIIP